MSISILIMKRMRFTFSLVLFILLPLASFAQIQQQIDNRTLYSQYKSLLSQLHSAIPNSEQYGKAFRDIIDIYPQLMNAAILNQKRNNYSMALAFSKACVDIADMPQFESHNLSSNTQFPQFVYFVASVYYASKEYTAAANYFFRYLKLNVNTPESRNTIYANLIDCFIQMGKTELAVTTQQMALVEYPEEKGFLSVNVANLPKYQKVIPSDVDNGIPTINQINNKTFAFIVGNENYQSLEHVQYAIHDAEIMSLYCKKTLGIPENQVYTYIDATYNNILSCLRKMKELSDAHKGDIDIVFYYSGHGMPDESTHESFLMPVDADGFTTDGCYSIGRLYGDLNNLNAKRVIVFLDACFSGAKRDGGMLVSSRGVGLEPRKEEPKGKLVVLSASTGKQTAFPYKEKSHGMFTYYLLKHLKDSNGDTTLGELSDYVLDNVGLTSISVNNKSQTPTVSCSPSLSFEWRDWKPE